MGWKFRKEIVLVAISFFVFLTSLNNQPQISDLVFNADILYPAILYQDLITDKNPIYEWSLTPSPYFFPDISIFFLIKLFVIGGVESLYLTFFFQAIGLLGALLLFVRSGADSEENKNTISHITIFVYSIFLISFSFQSYFFPSFGFAAHGGALIFTFISGALWFSKKDWKRKIVFWCLFGAIQILLIVSDPLYFFYFSLPCLIYSAEEWIRNKNKKELNSILLLLVFTGIGLTAYKNLAKVNFIFIPTNYYQRDSSLNFLQILWISIQNQIRNTPYSFTALTGFYLLSSLLLLISKGGRKNQNRFSNQISFLIRVLLVSFLGILISGTITGLFQLDGIAIRYLLPLLFFWIPFIIIAFFRLSLSYKKQVFLGFNLLYFIIVVSVLYWGDLRPRLYRDSLADCLDQNQEILSLKRGLSNFWDSRRIRIFSRKNLRADNYLKDLHPEYWQNSWTWFTKTPEEEYNFAVLPGLDEEKLSEEFGEPKHRLSCQKHEILIWDSKAKERFVRFREKKKEEVELWHKLTGRKKIL
ncbi:hypothetical protein [Leptospira stimsonii]|uniref:Glycosyltransferase RgtA/B/C/D-like domain-containing protein n=1 Tax=Leptospira stimsonii TaxID=2202203 RepID=A0ABY2MXC5_9LEPT|nr:hypothetical protein [Leptospira stimsonii]TGK20313.1 hypothetical protein EHO98_09745 [Leptospira stimsonii]TGM10901.1 hypothetical protein EHQ90_17555 [Leptospira stimsonii]